MQELATLIFLFCFVFLSVFQRKRKPPSILLSPSIVNKKKRCFRAGRNCEEIGFQILFVLDCLKTVSRAAFWRQPPCSEGGQRRVGRSCVGVSGWDKTQVAVASDSSQVSAMPGSQGGQGEVRCAVERLHETLPPHKSIIFCNRGPGWPEPVLAGREVEEDRLPSSWSPGSHGNAQGKHAEGPESVLEVFMSWWYPTTPLLARLPSHQQPEGSIHGSSEKQEIALNTSQSKG